MSALVKLTAHSTIRSAPKWTLAPRPSSQERGETVKHPGPGQYGSPPSDSRVVRTPSFAFGSSVRQADRKRLGINSKWKVPGPGSYMPDNPQRKGGPTWGFGSQEQRPTVKAKITPPPGTYNVRTDMKCSGGLMAGRRSVARSASAPGPGAYTPGYSQVETIPKWGFGADSRKEDSLTRTARSMPGPGTYEVPKTLNGNITTKSSPTFTFTARRPPPTSDTTPGPHIVHTQFD
mmetsp:Transcript_31589/g.58047  ORF Transcript_31589/g.58047 Transcript_31589/m.58047 type:complete len:233 (+) Transcript_31589:40-738(+)